MNCWPSGKYGRGSFCFNYCLNSAWHGGDQFVALLRWYGSPGFFDSGLQLICICLVSCFSFSSRQYPIDSLWGSGLVSLLASQAHQHHGHLTNIAPQIITDCGNLTLNIKQLGLWASPPFLQTLGPWFPNEIQNLLSSEKRTLDHWVTVQFFLSLALVRRLWEQL